MASHCATPEGRRSHCAFVSGVLDRVSATHENRTLALVAAMVSDLHRVQNAMWLRAESKTAPYEEFFSLSDLVFGSFNLGGALSLPMFRHALTEACAKVSLPVVFYKNPNLNEVTLEVRNLPALYTPPLNDFLIKQAYALPNSGYTDCEKLQIVALCELLSESKLTGDQDMLFAQAMMAGVDLLLGEAKSEDGAIGLILKFLGPVRGVRMKPQMREAGLEIA